MSDRIGTGATLSIGHKGAIHVTALAAGQRSSSFAPPLLRPRVSALSDVPLGSSDALLQKGRSVLRDLRETTREASDVVTVLSAAIEDARYEGGPAAILHV